METFFPVLGMDPDLGLQQYGVVVWHPETHLWEPRGYGMGGPDPVPWFAARNDAIHHVLQYTWYPMPDQPSPRTLSRMLMDYCTGRCWPERQED